MDSEVKVMLLVPLILLGLLGLIICYNYYQEREVLIRVVSTKIVKKPFRPVTTEVYGINDKISIFGEYEFELGETYFFKLKGSDFYEIYELVSCEKRGE